MNRTLSYVGFVSGICSKRASQIIRLASISSDSSKISAIDHVSDLPPEYVNRAISRRVFNVNPSVEKMKKTLKPSEKKNAKFLRFAILGSPNAGKSVITNSLAGTNVVPVSAKVHTTRKLTRAIGIHGDTQMVFVDTPGLISAKHKKYHHLENSLLLDPERAVENADMIGVVVDASNMYTRHYLAPRILHILHRYRSIKSILILTKVDKVPDKGLLLELANSLCAGRIAGEELPRQESEPEKDHRSGENRLHHKAHIADLMQKYSSRRFDSPDDASFIKPEEEFQASRLARLVAQPTHLIPDADLQRHFRDENGWPNFERIFMVSALKGDGMSELKDYLVGSAVKKVWEFHESMVTDQNPQQLAIDFVRAKLLESLRKRMPYTLKYSIQTWNYDDEQETLKVKIKVKCETDDEVKVVIGPNGKSVNKTCLEAGQNMRNLFQCDVHLNIVVEA